MPRVTVFDYGAGNLHSLVKAFTASGVTVVCEPDPILALETDILVLPGVGNFSAAVARIADAREAMRRAILGGLSTLGVCLGMQLLFDESEEGAGAGLGVISGHVTALQASKVPQIGWNEIADGRDSLFTSSGLSMAYYANSFVCRPRDTRSVIGWTTHGADRFPAAIRVGRTVGVQFHPEKSSASGVRFVRAFLDEATR